MSKNLRQHCREDLKPHCHISVPLCFCHSDVRKNKEVRNKNSEKKKGMLKSG